MALSVVGRRFLGHPAVVGLGLFVLLLALCTPTIVTHASKSRPLFVLDEFAYADYLHKVHGGQPYVRQGELTGQETLRELACRGYTPASNWPERPPCDAPSYNPAEFPNAGINSADVHPPTYFLITDAGARVIMALGIRENLIDAGRLFGAVWMAAGLLALWYLLRGFGVGRVAASLGLGLVSAPPVLRWQWYYLTPDAADILVGSLVVLAALRWERTGRGLPVLAGAGALAMAFKAPNVIVVVAVAATLAARAVLAWRAGPEPGGPGLRRHLLAAASLLGGAGVVAVAWLAVRLALALPDGLPPGTEHFPLTDLRLGNLTENLGRFISVLDVGGSQSYPFALLTSYLLVGSLLAAMATLDHDDVRHTLAVAGGATLIVGPLLLVFSTVLATGTYFIIEARYGASLIPLQVAVAASLWRSRTTLLAAGALVVAFNLAVFVVLVRQ